MPTEPQAVAPGTVPCIRTLSRTFGCTGCGGRHEIGGRPMAMSEVVLQSYAVALIGYFGLRYLSIPNSVLLPVRGYPDLTIWGGQRLMLRELKRQGETWSTDQRQVAGELRASGVDVGLWLPVHLYRGTIEQELSAAVIHEGHADVMR